MARKAQKSLESPDLSDVLRDRVLIDLSAADFTRLKLALGFAAAVAFHGGDPHNEDLALALLDLIGAENGRRQRAGLVGRGETVVTPLLG